MKFFREPNVTEQKFLNFKKMRILFVLILFLVLAQSVPLNWVVKFRLLKPVLLDYLNEYESEKNAGT